MVARIEGSRPTAKEKLNVFGLCLSKAILERSAPKPGHVDAMYRYDKELVIPRSYRNTERS